VLLNTFKKCAGQPYSVLHTDRPISAEYDILSAEEETPEHLRARLHHMSGDVDDNFVMTALPPGPRARGRSPPATTIVNEGPLGLAQCELHSTPIQITQQAEQYSTLYSYWLLRDASAF
jgi:hypothetical protein